MDRFSKTSGNAVDALASILDRAPPVAKPRLRDDTLLTAQWGHGPLHDYLPSMQGHVIITYYDQPQEISWQVGSDRLTSTTRSGSITIIPDGHEGRWDIAGPIGVSHVFMTEERLQSCADMLVKGRRVELQARVGFDDPIAARLMEMLGRDAESDTPSSRLFVEQATDLLCTQILRSHSSFDRLSAAPPPRGLAGWQVNRVTGYMRDHLGEDIGLNELSSIVGLSRYHFCTSFRLATGTTPHGRMIRLRMDRARQLLSDPKFRITDVALAVGYKTPSSFAASFRKLIGVTPTEFRRQL